RSHLRMPRTRPSDEVVGGAVIIYPISIRSKQFGVRRQSAAATALWMRGVPNRSNRSKAVSPLRSATALQIIRSLMRSVQQCFARDFFIVEVKDFAADDLIVLVTLARYQNQIISASLFDGVMNCLAAIG